MCRLFLTLIPQMPRTDLFNLSAVLPALDGFEKQQTDLSKHAGSLRLFIHQTTPPTRPLEWFPEQDGLLFG